MKFINLQIENEISSKGIPCELLLYLGKIAKSKQETHLFIQTNEEKKNLVFYNSIKSFLSCNKMKNINLVSLPLNMGCWVSLSCKLNLFFSNKVTEKSLIENAILKNFIQVYEQLFGVLPYYIEDKKYIDKYLFINDIFLQFGADITLH